MDGLEVEIGEEMVFKRGNWSAFTSAYSKTYMYAEGSRKYNTYNVGDEPGILKVPPTFNFAKSVD